MRTIIAAALAAASLGAAVAHAAPTDVELWRLDCGRIDLKDMSSFSDTGEFDGKAGRLPVSCYLVRHGAEYLLWDTGLPVSVQNSPAAADAPVALSLSRPLGEELAQLGLTPDRIRYVGLSHHHLDHSGQADTFAHAVLLMGADDFQLITGPHPPQGQVNDFSHLAPWTKGQAKVTLVEHDLDVFGDGSVQILATPGHTRGHTSLLVRLAQLGPVILTGDLWHQEAERRLRTVPVDNDSRADTLASYDRIDRLAARLKARVIIGHDERDIAVLPAFPASAH